MRGAEVQLGKGPEGGALTDASQVRGVQGSPGRGRGGERALETLAPAVVPEAGWSSCAGGESPFHILGVAAKGPGHTGSNPALPFTGHMTLSRSLTSPSK